MFKLNKRWTGEMICRHIFKRRKRPLNYLHYSQNYPDVHAAAIRIFGSWKNAIEECGIDYKDIRKYKTWSKMKVIDAIQTSYKLKEPLSSNYIQHRTGSAWENQGYEPPESMISSVL